MSITIIRYTIGIIVAVIMAVVLFIGAASSGKKAYDKQRDLLTQVERNINGIDLAKTHLLTHTRNDFDEITEWQILVNESINTLLASSNANNKELAEILINKKQLVDDFKALYSIYRNSIASFVELSTQLRSNDNFLSLDNVLIDRIERIEKDVLRYTFLNEVSASIELEKIFSDIEKHPQYGKLQLLDNWKNLRLHIDKLISLATELVELSNTILVMPVDVRIDKLRIDNDANFIISLNRAKYFQKALLIYLFILLSFIIYTILRIRKYVQLIEGHKETLEKSVIERTEELAEANELLKIEMQEAEAMQKVLSQAQKLESIGQLAAGVAHEINTPTQYVGDNTRFVKEVFGDIKTVFDTLIQLKAENSTSISIDAIDAAMQKADIDYLLEEIPRALNESIEGIERVSNIVIAMKDFSHPAQNKTLVDLNAAITSTITVASSEWKYIADIETDFDQNLPWVSCLPGEFNQVILNMIVNAAHAIADIRQDKGVIRISTTVSDAWAEICIADTGSGMTEEVRGRIFDPFFTTKGVGKGTGQGLSLAYDIIVNKHAGSIEVESEVGQGTQFIIRLPLQTDASIEESDAA